MDAEHEEDWKENESEPDRKRDDYRIGETSCGQRRGEGRMRALLKENDEGLAGCC